MATSRIQKFKDYRNSLIKEDCPVSETPIDESRENTSHFETTSTLPYEEVMQGLNKDDEIEDFKKKQKNILVLQIVIFSVIVALIIAGIIVFAVLVF